MSSDFSPALRAELLDDFYAECDDLLANIRAQLAALDRALAAATADDAALESLYRSVHSFKGNAAIVGLAPAEQLAHAAENLLRSLSRHETPLTAAALDLLGHVAHRLEQLATTHRLQQPAPEIQPLLDALAAFQPPLASSPTPPAVAAPAAPATPPASRGGWRARFTPSPERDARGININAVRARLAAVGEIVHAAPVIAGGGMSFDFELAISSPPPDLAAWEADGILWQPVAPNVPAAPARATNEASAAAPPASMFIAPSHIVRVDLGRLDELMRLAGELVIHRSRLDERIAQVSGDRLALQEVSSAIGRSLRDLRGAITRVRLVPVAEIFSRLPFVVRDLAHDSGRQVRLVLEGQETEIDKYLVERLKEPLLHLVRNALSHGIEPPDARVRAGKPAEATLLLRAATAGDAVLLQVRDDGGGIAADVIAARAAALGLAVPEVLDAPALLNVICAPGFSTREQADRAAGRGVGMAVVASTVRELGGSLSLATEQGRWTQFTLRLPLTLSIAETIIVSAGDHTCAVPQGIVHEIIQVDAPAVRTIKDVDVAAYRDGLLPLTRLRALFGAPASAATQWPVLVVASDRGLTGLVVDRVHGQREVVVRPLRDPLVRVDGVSGATELGDGKPVLILDGAALSGGAVRPFATEAARARAVSPSALPSPA